MLSGLHQRSASSMQTMSTWRSSIVSRWRRVNSATLAGSVGIQETDVSARQRASAAIMRRCSRNGGRRGVGLVASRSRDVAHGCCASNLWPLSTFTVKGHCECVLGIALAPFVSDGGAALHVPCRSFDNVERSGAGARAWEVFRFNPPDGAGAVSLLCDLLVATGCGGLLRHVPGAYVTNATGIEGWLRR